MLAHWNTTPREYSNGQPRSIILIPSWAGETSNFNVFCLTRPGIESPTYPMHAQLLHYPAAVRIFVMVRFSHPHRAGSHSVSSPHHCNTRELPDPPTAENSYSNCPPAPHSHTAHGMPSWWPRSTVDRSLCGWCWPGRGSRTRRLILCNSPSRLG